MVEVTLVPEMAPSSRLALAGLHSLGHIRKETPAAAGQAAQGAALQQCHVGPTAPVWCIIWGRKCLNSQNKTLR